MKVLMFGMSSYPGGTENYIRNVFFHHDCSEKIQIDFITYQVDLAYSDEMEAFGYRVLRVPHLKQHPIAYFRAVSRILKEQAYDAVYINMLCAANPLPVYFAKKNKVPQIILHAHSNSTIKGLTRRVLHRLCRGYSDKAATLRLACSAEAARWLFNEKNTASPIEIVPNAIDTDKYCFSTAHREELRGRYEIREDELLLGSVGRFGPEKNNLFMLDILEKLLERRAPAKLMLVGDGSLRAAIEAKIAERHLEDRVILTGTVIDPYPYYSAFDCFLFPSSFEGFGISALEAQSCGLPCYCSDTLSEELNVTHTVQYLPLSAGAEHWANVILQNKNPPDRHRLNVSVKESRYNIATQRNSVGELIYGK